MQTRASHPIAFREARERAGLPPEEAARRMCLSHSLLRSIESDDDELTAVHSPADIQRFCSVLGVRPCELLAVRCQAKPLTPEEIAANIFHHCRAEGMTVTHFEEMVGWCVTRSLEKPQRFFHDYSLDALRDICRELDLEWERIIVGL
ncbi:MAG: hypothetical protein JWQ04_3224 [Pedosphaera sp.]|nr:hypothetical protein [Pedosphaera sp.]